MSRLERILAFANANEWTDATPVVSLKLTIAIDSLQRQRSKFWSEGAEALTALLQTNQGVSNIFNEFDERTIGYAIRLARLNQLHGTT